MSDEFKFSEELMAENRALSHAIQTGVGFDHARGGQDGTPKHLRTGVNIAMCETGALGRLLMRKGICTPDEYLATVNEMLRIEVEGYEKKLSADSGVKVTLG